MEDVRDWFIEITIDLRRAVDLISLRPSVDINRIAYIDHSLGALFGGILSGVDKRMRASVLMAGVESFTDVVLLNMPTLAGDDKEKYKNIMKPIDSPALRKRCDTFCPLLPIWPSGCLFSQAEIPGVL
jgi:hypothetical protein